MMRIIRNSGASRRSQVVVVFLLAFLIAIFLPLGRTALGSMLPRLPTALILAAGTAIYFFALLRMSVGLQLKLVWLSLLGLFLAFFYSFNLNGAFILEKLPFLISKGVVTTLYISGMAITIAFCLAVIGAVAKLSGNGIAMGIGNFYTSYFRGVPLLMQLLLVYTGLPQIGIVIDPIPAGVIALSTCYGAYMTEIFRAAIQSIPRGQWEAAEALGLTRAMTFRKVIMPQSMRIIIPPTANQFIAMLKDSSLVSVVGVWDLMFVARAQGRADFRILEMLITASLIYWILSIALEVVQSRIERHYAAPERAG